MVWKKETSWDRLRSSPACLEWPPKLSKRWGFTPIVLPREFLQHSHPDYRRRILTQLNRGESENDLKRHIGYWKRGELQQSRREGQEDQLNALGLVTNAVIVWNTIYMQVALDAIRKAGYDVHPSDEKRLYPLECAYINIVGRYSFNVPEEVLKGKLRPLQPMDNNAFV